LLFNFDPLRQDITQGLYNTGQKTLDDDDDDERLGIQPKFVFGVELTQQVEWFGGFFTYKICITTER
jgi:hypothetical protein